MNWPDWEGETAIVIASGPSLTKQDVESCKGRGRIIAIKKCVELAPWADVVYGCDGPWWRSVRGLPDFKGLKLSYEAAVCTPEFGIQKVEIPDKKSVRFLFDRIGVVGSGGNSGFQAINLAAQFGAKRIILLGFEMHSGAGAGAHWYGRNNWMQANNPDLACYERWKKALELAAPDLTRRGIEVINCSRNTALTCFRQMSISKVFEDEVA